MSDETKLAEQAQMAEAASAAERPQPKTAEHPATEDYQKAIEEYRKIQSGLQSALERTRRELDEARKSLTATDQEKQQLSLRIAEYEQKLSEVEKAMQKMQEEAKAYAAAARRAQIVATRFPHLAPLLEVGALPPYESDEQFAEALQKISDALAKAAEAKVVSSAAGVKPAASPPRGGTQVSREQLWQAMQEAANKGDWDTYNRLREEWYKSFE